MVGQTGVFLKQRPVREFGFTPREIGHQGNWPSKTTYLRRNTAKLQKTLKKKEEKEREVEEGAPVDVVRRAARSTAVGSVGWDFSKRKRGPV